MSGKVYIASMNLRGTWATSPPNTKKVNVTSAQRKDHKFRLAFSPMTPIQNKYKGYYCFENYWQSGKRYQDIDSKKVTDWWKKQNKGRRRYPDGKGKQVLYAKFPHINENLGYIESRKQVYVPEYFNLIKNNPVLIELKKELSNGTNLVVYDFDGIRNDDGTPTCKKVTLDLLREKMLDTRYPFGHGYVVAGAILGINPEDYINFI